MSAWVPLVDSTMFAGVQTDVMTVASGIIAVSVIILGVFLIVRAMSN